MDHSLSDLPPLVTKFSHSKLRFFQSIANIVIGPLKVKRKFARLSWQTFCGCAISRVVDRARGLDDWATNNLVIPVWLFGKSTLLCEGLMIHSRYYIWVFYHSRAGLDEPAIRKGAKGVTGMIVVAAK